MQPDHTPSPHRFQVFTQLPNGKGFRIKNSRYIYFFDKYGGWYDEYNNYYNCDGESQDPPADEDDDFERVLLEQEYGDVDQDDHFDREYGAPGGDDHHGDDHQHHHNPHQKVLQVIAHNATILHEYPIKTPLRVDFENMSFKATKQQILKHYQSKIGNGLLNVVMTKDNNRFTGEGYFVCQDVGVAEKLTKYEGEEFLGRRISFDVESVKQNLIDPVSKEEMGLALNQDDFEPLIKEKPAEQNDQSKNPKKKYLTKTQIAEQKKQQPKPLIHEHPKPQPIKTSQNPQQPPNQEKKAPTWSTYQGQVTMFPKKTSFTQWMSSLKFNENQHFKNPKKAESKDPAKRFATVELRSDVFEKIQGTVYQGEKVLFERVN